MTRRNVYVWFENLYLPQYLRISTFPPVPHLSISHMTLLIAVLSTSPAWHQQPAGAPAHKLVP